MQTQVASNFQAIEDFNVALETRLSRPFTIGNIGAGHTVVHVNSMKESGPKILGIMGAGGRRLTFDLQEFKTGTYLHNVDRSFVLRDEIMALGAEAYQRIHGADPSYNPTSKNLKREIEDLGEEAYCRHILADSPYTPEAQDRIISAVMHHRRKEDLPDDPPLDQAIRIADKLDRFAPCGIIGCGASHPMKDHYGLDGDPFWDGGKTGEDDLNTHIRMFCRPLEWYAMLPSDEARALINRRWFRMEIEFIRCFGEEVSQRTGYPNRIEENLERAFGEYYGEMCEICGPPHEE